MRFVLIDQAGAIIQAVELASNWDQPDAGRDAWTPPEGMTVVPSDEAGIGWMFDGKAFLPPPSNPDPPPSDEPPVRDLPAELDALKAMLVAKGTISQADVTAISAADKPV